MLMPQSFVFNVYLLIGLLLDYQLDPRARQVCCLLESQLKDKLDAINRHDTFSKYKSAAPGSPERESLRRDYFDMVGIHRDWFSKIESLL